MTLRDSVLKIILVFSAVSSILLSGLLFYLFFNDRFQCSIVAPPDDPSLGLSSDWCIPQTLGVIMFIWVCASTSWALTFLFPELMTNITLKPYKPSNYSELNHRYSIEGTPYDILKLIWILSVISFFLLSSFLGYSFISDGFQCSIVAPPDDPSLGLSSDVCPDFGLKILLLILLCSIISWVLMVRIRVSPRDLLVED